jgi:hypothetical protein
MPTYRVIVNGRDFLFNVEGKRRRMGFYQTVFVEALDAGLAEIEAVRIVRSDPELREIAIREESTQPSLHLSNICEIEASNLPSSQPKGRSLYLEKRWWQFWR